jgi:hypothetical protein
MPQAAPAQLNQRVFGTANDERAADILPIAGGFYTAGMWNSGDIHVVRFADAGGALWDNLYSTPGVTAIERGFSIARLRDGSGTIVGLESDRYGNNLQVGLMKLNNDGIPLWSFAYPGTAGLNSAGVRVRERATGGLVAVSRLRNAAGGAQAAFLRTLANGDIVNSRLYSVRPVAPAEHLHFTDFRELPDGKILVVGTWATAGVAESDIVAAVLNADGTFVNAKRYGVRGVREFGVAVVIKDGFAVLIAQSLPVAPAASGTIAIKIDAALNPLGIITIPSFLAAPGAAAFDAAGVLAVAGSNNEGDDPVLVRLSAAPALGLLSSRKFTHGLGAARAVAPTVDGAGAVNYRLTGALNSPLGAGMNDIWLARTDRFGAIGCSDANAGLIASPPAPGLRVTMTNIEVTNDLRRLPLNLAYRPNRGVFANICERP